MIVELPYIIERHERRVGLIFLSRIDRIRILRPASGGIDGIEAIDRSQSRHVAVAEVCDSEQRQCVVSSVEYLPTVELELFAVLQSIEKAVAERAFHCQPRIR